MKQMCFTAADVRHAFLLPSTGEFKAWLIQGSFSFHLICLSKKFLEIKVMDTCDSLIGELWTKQDNRTDFYKQVIIYRQGRSITISTSIYSSIRVTFLSAARRSGCQGTKSRLQSHVLGSWWSRGVCTQEYQQMSRFSLHAPSPWQNQSLSA